MRLQFISLVDVLAAIQVQSSRPDPHPASRVASGCENDSAADEFLERAAPRIAEARHYAEAARLLNESLHNGNEKTKPRWAEYDKKLGFPTSEGKHAAAAQRDGLEILAYATHAHRHQMDIIRNHVQSAPDAETQAPSLDVRFVIAPKSIPLSRPRDIGFDREQLVSFLNEHGIAHSLSSGAHPAKVGRSEWSDERKLALLAEYGNGGRVTHKALGEMNNVSRQFITETLKEARAIKEARLYFPGPVSKNRRR